MPSKGIDFYGFVADGYEIEVRKANAGNKDNPDCVQHITSQSVLRFYSDHYEINTYSKTILGIEVPVPIYTEGRFQFIAKKNGQQLFERSIRVDGLSGNIDSVDVNNIRIPSIVDQNYSLSFGLYDSDAGIISDLPNSHQVWATLTPNRAEWQRQLFEKYAHKNIKLRHLILPGTHDTGMFTNLIDIALINLANTQRDGITRQLELGARFFDFRPAALRPDFMEGIASLASSNFMDAIKKIGFATIATCLQPLVGQMRHLHMFLPGCQYDDFISETLSFLVAHPKEIVVVKISKSGIESSFANIPSFNQVENYTRDLISKLGFEHKIAIGKAENLDTNVNDLIDTKQRLILISNDDDKILSSYTDDDKKADRTYKSYEPSHIINSLNYVVDEINKGNSKNKMLVDLQLQLTATGLTGAIARAVSATHISTSPLLATKAKTDFQSYSWLLNNLPNLSLDLPLISLIDDFYDNALTETSFSINDKRLARL